MKLTQITAEPKLVRVLLDDEETVADYSEALEFWTWDRQPMDKFIQLANMDQNDFGSIVNVMRDLILDEAGKPVIDGNQVLPSKVLMKAVGKVSTILGK